MKKSFKTSTLLSLKFNQSDLLTTSYFIRANVNVHMFVQHLFSD